MTDHVPDNTFFIGIVPVVYFMCVGILRYPIGRLVLRKLYQTIAAIPGPQAATS
jgi:hypothetical protein